MGLYTMEAGGSWEEFLKLSQAAQVHPPYLTNVLKEKAHLNADQLFSALKFMGYSNTETEFMLLLMEKEKCVLKTRKEALQTQLNLLKSQQGKTEANINVEVIAPQEDIYSRYYLDSSIRLIYNFLGIKKFSQNPELIEKSLNISGATARSALSYLMDVGLIEKDRHGHYLKTKSKMHLPRESFLFESQKKLFQYRCLEHQERTRSETDYNFSVTFTATPQIKEEIRKKFMSFLKEVQPLVENADAEEVFQLNFDLFSWSF